MAAGINDRFNRVISGTTRPVATTLSAQKVSGATTASVVATTGWDNTTAVHGIMYRTDSSNNKVPGSQIDWKGTFSGTTISNFQVTAGSDDTYAVGTTVELSPTAAWADDLVGGILIEHNQDGTHGAITATSLTASGAVQGGSVIATGDIQHRSVSLETIRADIAFDFVSSGCVWSGDSYGSTRAASMTSGVVYIGGKRVAVSAVTARTFTASRDTYIDVDNTGTIAYTEVTNNAASSALAANSIRLGIIVTGASNIANVGSVNQGQENKVLPIASSIAYAVTDSLGNLICPRDPHRKVLGYKQITSNFSTASTSVTSVTGLTCPVIVPNGRKVKITISSTYLATTGSTGTYIETLIQDATGATLIGGSSGSTAGSAYGLPATAIALHTPTTNSRTYQYQVRSGSAGTLSVPGTSVSPAYIMVELV